MNTWTGHSFLGASATDPLPKNAKGRRYPFSIWFLRVISTVAFAKACGEKRRVIPYTAAEREQPRDVILEPKMPAPAAWDSTGSLQDAAAVLQRVREVVDRLVFGLTNLAVPPNERERAFGPRADERQLIPLGRPVKTRPFADVVRAAHDSLRFRGGLADPPAVLRYLTWKGAPGQPEVGRGTGQRDGARGCADRVRRERAHPGEKTRRTVAKKYLVAMASSRTPSVRSPALRRRSR